MEKRFVKVPLDALLKFEKSGRNDHQGWSEKVCPICHRGAYDIAADGDKERFHNKRCWLGDALAEARVSS